MTKSPMNPRCSRILSALAIATVGAFAPVILADQTMLADETGLPQTVSPQQAPPKTKSSGKTSPMEHLTPVQRSDAIEHAEVWAPTSVPSMDLRAGPQDKGSYAPFE